MGLDILHVKPCVKSIDAIECFTLDEFRDFPEFLEKHYQLITTIDNHDGTKTPVIYYREEGCQRKQMKPGFTDVFKNEKLYFDIDIVRKAKLFLQANSEDKQGELEKMFQINFIDNFIEGESIFFISW